MYSIRQIVTFVNTLHTKAIWNEKQLPFNIQTANPEICPVFGKKQGLFMYQYTSYFLFPKTCPFFQISLMYLRETLAGIVSMGLIQSEHQITPYWPISMEAWDIMFMKVITAAWLSKCI